MNPTSFQLETIRQSIRGTARRFNQCLSQECVEDLVQEVFLRLWLFEVEDKLNDCMAYVRQVAVNVTIDLLRSRGAQKRGGFRGASQALALASRQLARTPEEIAIAREEARRALARDSTLRRRVASTMRRLAW